MPGVLSEYGRLDAVLVKHVRDAFVSEHHIEAEWRGLNYAGPPDLTRAIAEYDRFLEILTESGAKVLLLPPDAGTTLDSIYPRDAAMVTADGVVLCRMGKAARRGEPAAVQQYLSETSWTICGAIAPPGCLEGGDLIWVNDRTLAVGEGTRTNAEGIRQLRALLAGTIDELAVVPLPDYPGQHDVMHVMSLISPVDRDLAVVYSRLLPAPFRTWLLDRGLHLIDVSDEEFETMGTNVLALGPRDCVMVDGNPRTRAALERAGARVQVYAGVEISLKGGGGPTCLTRPLARE